MTAHTQPCLPVAVTRDTRATGAEMMRVFWALTTLAAGLALVAMLAAVLTPVNVYDTLPIKCGHKLRDTCPSTGVNWR